MPNFEGKNPNAQSSSHLHCCPLSIPPIAFHITLHASPHLLYHLSAADGARVPLPNPNDQNHRFSYAQWLLLTLWALERLLQECYSFEAHSPIPPLRLGPCLCFYTYTHSAAEAFGTLPPSPIPLNCMFTIPLITCNFPSV